MSDIVNIFSIPSSTSTVVSAVQPIITAVGTIVAAVVAAALGATIFKSYDTWHNAELASRALSGLTSNFARHCIYNMVRIALISVRSPLEFPSDTLLEKQKFSVRVVSDATRDRMQLIGTELIFNLEALFLRLRNFNIEIDFAIENKTSTDDIGIVLDYIFLKNMQLVEVSHAIAGKFDNLVIDSKNTGYKKRIYDILRFRRTIFNVNDFKFGSRKIFYVLSSRPSLCTVDSILQRYLEYKVSEKAEYNLLIETYKRINIEYPGNQREWFGVKWTPSQRRNERVVREDR